MNRPIDNNLLKKKKVHIPPMYPDSHDAADLLSALERC